MAVNIEKAFNTLMDEGLIKYDAYLHRDDLERVLDVTYDGKFPMEYFGPFILLQQYMEKKAYITTRRNTQTGDLRILPAYMNHLKANHKQKKHYRQNQRIKECLENTDPSELNYNEQKKLLHSLHTLSLMTQAMHSILQDIDY